MMNLGRSIVFCLKYWEQMRPFVWDEEGQEELMKILPDREQHEQMIRRVAGRARQQVTEFLTACASQVEKYFKEWFDAKIRTPKRTVEDDWHISLEVRPRGRKKQSSTYCTTGICLDFLVGKGPVIVLYVWAQGGNRAEEKVARILGERVMERSKALPGWGGGCVIFSKIPIRKQVDSCKDFDIPSEPLIHQVVEDFRKKIKKKDVEKISDI